VAALKWNGWQHSAGIGGSFGPEYAVMILIADASAQSTRTFYQKIINDKIFIHRHKEIFEEKYE